jgi:murein DD-endopeptidase MepM/ murein hydrolase activator NlpD
VRRRPGVVRGCFHLLVLLLVVASAAYAVGSPRNRGLAQTADAARGLTFSGIGPLFAAREATSLGLAAPGLPPASPARPEAAAYASVSGLDPSVRLAAARAPGDQPLLAPVLTATPASSPTPSPSPTPSAPDCDRSASDLYCVYTVQQGDTLSKIAKLFGLKGTEGVASWELIVQSNRPDITSADDYIQPGQKLRIPLENGIVHIVLTGETLSELAAGYGVDTSAIEGAGSDSAATLAIGQQVLIKDPARLPPLLPAAAPAALATPTPEPTGTTAPEPTGTPVPDSTATAAASASPTPTARRGTATPTPSRSSFGFIWPVTGPISSYFGPSHPLGIDIDLYNNPNAPIVAAAAGTVTFAGGDPCCSYGLYVIVDHGAGVTTLYAHLSRIAVSQGQKVTQGQLLGYGGRTGYATGNHLHFEVRINGNVIDPLTVLP